MAGRKSSLYTGLTLEDFVVWQKSARLDMVYLQQAVCEPVIVLRLWQRQLESCKVLKGLTQQNYRF